MVVGVLLRLPREKSKEGGGGGWGAPQATQGLHITGKEWDLVNCRG